MNTASPDAYSELSAHVRELAELASCGSLLGWDMETLMPAGGMAHRARQIAALTTLVHERRTSPEFGGMLDRAAESTEAGTKEAANVREMKREFDRRTKLPVDLVREISETTSLSRNAWREAREKGDFALFRPWLEKVVALKRREADAIGFEDEAYDALLDEYEPHMTTRDVSELLHPLRAGLADLLGRILDASDKPDGSILERVYPVGAQAEFGRTGAAGIGFQFDNGRLDVTTHPFCSTIGPGDTRITTRYTERFFSESYFGTLHEAGHGVYEQGLDQDAFGLPSGQAASMAVHESQSRLWENLVGRSHGYWRHNFAAAQAKFPEALGDVGIDDFYRALNEVKPSFIRVEADEVTYNLHVFLRFELERAMLDGDLAVADLPAAWNETFERDFRIKPQNDSLGCLQDIHWSLGSLGYFPTYSLGNLYASQLFARAGEELGDLDAMFAAGEFTPLRKWLQEKIYDHGGRYPPRELIERATGKAPSADALLAHLETKYGAVYRL
ncbi:MAG: carboxypeptidase M32 [Planctomycetota bacterium]